MDYVVANRDHFAAFVTEDFDAYVRRKRQDGQHGNHVEMQVGGNLNALEPRICRPSPKCSVARCRCSSTMWSR